MRLRPGAARRLARRVATRRVSRRASRDAASIAGATSLRLLDIGGAGGPKSRWHAARAHVDLTIVEPDRLIGATAMATADGYRSVTVVDAALAREAGTRTLHLCKHPRQSSLLEPRSEFFANYHDGHKWTVVRTTKLPTLALDMIALPDQYDFLKIDTQGSELEILQGAPHTIAGALGLEIEVEFREVYRDQPLFGDVSAILADAGFDFVDFVALARWQRSHPDGLRTFLGELIHADALFLRSPEWIVNKADDSDVVRRALLIYLVYGQFDLMRVVLRELSRHGKALDGHSDLVQIVERLHLRRVRRQRQARMIASALRWLEPDLDLHVVP